VATPSAMAEICCQGANLTRIFSKFSNTQSPFVEVEFDGQVVGRTRPHEGGDRCPRWNDAPVFVDPTRGRGVVFRVLIPGVFGQSNILCGEGTVDLRTLLQQQSPHTVPLQKKGESTGFLQLTCRKVDTGQAQKPATAAATSGGPASAGNAAGAGASAKAPARGSAGVLSGTLVPAGADGALARPQDQAATAAAPAAVAPAAAAPLRLPLEQRRRTEALPADRPCGWRCGRRHGPGHGGRGKG